MESLHRVSRLPSVAETVGPATVVEHVKREEWLSQSSKVCDIMTITTDVWEDMLQDLLELCSGDLAGIRVIDRNNSRANEISPPSRPLARNRSRTLGRRLSR
jgi:hypothetical protein